MDSPRQGDGMSQVQDLSKLSTQEQQETGPETGLETMLEYQQQVQKTGQETNVQHRSEAHPESRTRDRTEKRYPYKISQAWTESPGTSWNLSRGHREQGEWRHLIRLLRAIKANWWPRCFFRLSSPLNRVVVVLALWLTRSIPFCDTWYWPGPRKKKPMWSCCVDMYVTSPLITFEHPGQLQTI